MIKKFAIFQNAGAPGSANYLFLRNEGEADEGQLRSIWRPGWNVDGALTAEKSGEDCDFAVRQSHEAQLNVFVFRMAFDFFWIGEEDHFCAVRRKVWEPVVEFAGGDLHLVAAV